MNHYYLKRAQAAHAAAEAADDPRDKAAYHAAAKTWEQLAKPRTGITYSMEPDRRDLAALKKDVAEAIAAPYDAVATNTNQHGAQMEAFIDKDPQTRLTDSVRRVAQRYPVEPPVTIEF